MLFTVVIVSAFVEFTSAGVTNGAQIKETRESKQNNRGMNGNHFIKGVHVD